MQESLKVILNETTFSRRASLADFIDTCDINIKNKYTKIYSQNDNEITKNQQEFGHKKRIKP